MKLKVKHIIIYMISFSFGGYINIIQSKHIHIQYNQPHTYINLSLRDYSKSIMLECIKEDNNIFNPYEYIYTPFDAFTPPVCKFSASHNSFFILIELLHQFDFLFEDVIKSIHIDSPGFIEALDYFRNQPKDIRHKLSTHNMNLKKLTYLYNKYAHSIDFITVCIDYNEDDTLNYIYYQILLSMCIQKQGGTLILKIGDTFTGLSIDILYLLNYLYDELYLTKPFVSDQNDSSKYLVCINFKMVSNIKDIIHKCLNTLDMSQPITRLFNGFIPIIFIDKIIELNLIFGQKHIEHIKHKITNKLKPSELQIDIIKKTYLSKCIKWCNKNNLPIN